MSRMSLPDKRIDADAITANEVPPAHAGNPEVELLEVEIDRLAGRERGPLPRIRIAVFGRLIAAAASDGDSRSCEPCADGGESDHGTHIENYEPRLPSGPSRQGPATDPEAPAASPPTRARRRSAFEAGGRASPRRATRTSRAAPRTRARDAGTHREPSPRSQTQGSATGEPLRCSSRPRR